MIVDSSRPGVARGVAWALVAAALLGFYLGRNVAAASARVGQGPSDFAHYHRAARALLDGESPYSVRGFLVPVLEFALVVWYLRAATGLDNQVRRSNEFRRPVAGAEPEVRIGARRQ